MNTPLHPVSSSRLASCAVLIDTIHGFDIYHHYPSHPGCYIAVAETWSSWVLWRGTEDNSYTIQGDAREDILAFCKAHHNLMS